MSNESKENHETISDIVAALRAVAYIQTAESPSSVLSFAKRIEAAAKREREAGAEVAQICGEIGEMVGREAACKKSSQVGNAAAMREALSDACYAMFNFLKTQNGGYEEMAIALDKAKSALAEPIRNCDVGTAEEQSDRFDKFCYSHDKCFRCPVKSIWDSPHRQKQLREIIRCEIIWAQMPYEEGGAE